MPPLCKPLYPLFAYFRVAYKKIGCKGYVGKSSQCNCEHFPPDLDIIFSYALCN